MTADTPMAVSHGSPHPPPVIPAKAGIHGDQRVKRQRTFCCLALLGSHDSKEATPILPPGVRTWNDGRHPHGCQPWIPAFARMTVEGRLTSE